MLLLLAVGALGAVRPFRINVRSGYIHWRFNGHEISSFFCSIIIR
jgi:hypothetical protein